jgi:hypothetical protein
MAAKSVASAGKGSNSFSRKLRYPFEFLTLKSLFAEIVNPSFLLFSVDDEGSRLLQVKILRIEFCDY